MLGDCRDLRRIGDAVHGAHTAVQGLNATPRTDAPRLAAMPV